MLSTAVALLRMPVALTHPFYTLTLSFQATSDKPAIFHHLKAEGFSENEGVSAVNE